MINIQPSNLVEELLKEFEEVSVEETDSSSFMGTTNCCNNGNVSQ